MKVLLDANILLSYLLAPASQRTISQVVNYCFAADVELLLPQELIAELEETLRSKRYFQIRILSEKIDQFVEQLTALATLSPPLEDISSYGRDLDDDYLVACGIVNEADYLVTGDADLLALGQVGSLQIVTPRAFLSLLRTD